MNNLTELQYGNPSIEILQFINSPSYLDILLTDFTEEKKFSFPDNDSSITKSELTDIVSKLNILRGDTPALTRYQQRYDFSVIQHYTDVRFDTSEETDAYNKTLDSVFSDILPLIFKLKHHYQRPRPYQLAHYYHLKLFPFHSNTADTPSYPCAHSCIGYVMAGVLGTHYPSAIKYFTDTASDLGASRVYMGLNFQSSVDMGKMVADKILINEEFVKKYKL